MRRFLNLVDEVVTAVVIVLSDMFCLALAFLGLLTFFNSFNPFAVMQPEERLLNSYCGATGFCLGMFLLYKSFNRKMFTTFF